VVHCGAVGPVYSSASHSGTYGLGGGCSDIEDLNVNIANRFVFRDAFEFGDM